VKLNHYIRSMVFIVLRDFLKIRFTFQLIFWNNVALIVGILSHPLFFCLSILTASISLHFAVIIAFIVILRPYILTCAPCSSCAIWDGISDYFKSLLCNFLIFATIFQVFVNVLKSVVISLCIALYRL
jgi:hypothetical protein